MNKNIGIGIIDIYDDDSILSILEHMPSEAYVSVFTSRESNLQLKVNSHKKIKNVSLSYIKNNFLHEFRKHNLEYYFIIHSDQVLKDKNVFDKIIDIGKTFGTWFLTGSMANTTEIEDDNGKILKISTEVNTKFIFTIKGIIDNAGFFNERYLNCQNLHILDYILTLIKKNLTLPYGFFPTISVDMLENKKHINSEYIKDFPSNEGSVQYSYGFFMNNHKFMPGHNDPKSTNKEQMMEKLEYIQKHYAKQ